MITKENERMSVGGGFLSVEEFYGLSTDTKPTNTANGSTFFEMDTGKMYRFNYSGTTWTETTHYGSDGFGPAPSGGGLPEVSAEDNGKVLTVVDGAWAPAAGGGSSGVLVVTINPLTGAFDKTWKEIKESALAIGKYEIMRDEETHYETWLLNQCIVADGDYVVGALMPNGTAFAVTDSETGYPVVIG